MIIRMKTNVTLSIDSGVVESMKIKNLNMSSLCESALRAINESFLNTSNQETCKHKFTFPFCVPAGLAKECMLCGKIERVVSPVKRKYWFNKVRT